MANTKTVPLIRALVSGMVCALILGSMVYVETQGTTSHTKRSSEKEPITGQGKFDVRLPEGDIDAMRLEEIRLDFDTITQHP